jgi:hypothetical protein
MKYFNKKWFACFLIAISFASPANSQNHILNGLLQIKELKYPIPEQVFESKELIFFLGAAEVINSFPYGHTQKTYVEKEKIKRIYLNSYKSNSSGDAIPNNLIRTFSIDFDKEGRVIKLEQYSKKGKLTSVAKIKYGPTIISSIQTKSSSYSFDEKTLKYQSPVKSLVLDNLYRVTYANRHRSYNGVGIDMKFKTKSDGEISEITERIRLANSGDPISTVVYRVIYNNNKYPAYSVKQSITGGKPCYQKYNPNEFVFSSDSAGFHQIRVARDFANGSIYHTTHTSYSIDENKITTLSTRDTDTRTRFPTCTQKYTAYFENDRLAGFIGNAGYHIKTDNNLLAKVVISLRRSLRGFPIPDGTYSYRYRTNHKISRIIFDSKEVIKIDDSQTVYHEI